MYNIIYKGTLGLQTSSNNIEVVNKEVNSNVDKAERTEQNESLVDKSMITSDDHKDVEKIIDSAKAESEKNKNRLVILSMLI